MSSHIAIVESLRHAAAAGESVVLATVVGVIGSSYGGVGTRMVIRVDGSTVGLVSGGCLESDLCAHALEVHSTGRERLVTYDTRADDDAVWGLGLGCNGLIEVLLQPLSPEQAIASADTLWAALTAEEPSVISTQFADEVVTPAVRLIVCGSGPDAAPVCRLARALGWLVSLVDHRAITEAHAQRFPGIAVVECPDPEALATVAPLGRRTAAVVMSHNFGGDTEYVRALLAAKVAYIGVLGPRARTERMLADLATRGDSPPDNSDALFGPVGLDLGGQGPEAIALAIIAEVSAVMHDRDATHLRERVAALRASASER